MRETMIRLILALSVAVIAGLPVGKVMWSYLSSFDSLATWEAMAGSVVAAGAITVAASDWLARQLRV